MLLGPCVVALVSVGAFVAPEGGSDDAVAEPGGFENAERLYRSGRAKFDLHDYRGAIEDWTEAYAALPPDAEGTERIRVDIVYNVAQARVKAYELDGDVTHLRQAKALLEVYLEERPDSSDAPKIQERLEEIEGRLAEAEGQAEVPDSEPEAVTSPTSEPVDADRGPTEPDGGNAKGLIIGGAVLTGLGGVGLGVMAAGMAMGTSATSQLDAQLTMEDESDRSDTLTRGYRSNALAVGGGVAGGVFVAAGVTMLVLGKRKQKQQKGRLSFAVHPEGAAVAWTGRF